MALVGATGLGLFAILYMADVFVTGTVPGPSAADPFTRYFHFDADHITDATSALGSLTAAVLGIVITVVSIIVQLAAAQYTGVTKMFLRDRTNIGVMTFYVVACVLGVWVSLSLHGDFVPRAALTTMMFTTTLGLVLMVPYFAYVFRFLEPRSIIARIEAEAGRTAGKGAGEGASGDEREHLQLATLASMEELTDIASNSISGKDKIIASDAVDALKDFACRYVPLKAKAPAAWFRLTPSLRHNPDFVAMDPESLADLESHRTWVEWKVMRQYLGIYNEALQAMRDITYLVAIDTRYIGEAALAAKDAELLTLVGRYLNSYLRAALNARDVRTAYNVLNQYRLLVEAMLRAGDGAAALTAVGHMKYYGHVSFQMNLSFVAETVAYDVGTLCQLAHELRVPEEDQVLAVFLDLDMPSTEREKEAGLKGVRKAQVKLAAYYLADGDEARAARIREDMAHEPAARLSAIRHELERVPGKDFWEIIDRGRNFEYMAPEQKAAMRRFLRGPRRRARTAFDEARTAPLAGDLTVASRERCARASAWHTAPMQSGRGWIRTTGSALAAVMGGVAAMGCSGSALTTPFPSRDGDDGGASVTPNVAEVDAGDAPDGSVPPAPDGGRDHRDGGRVQEAGATDASATADACIPESVATFCAHATCGYVTATDQCGNVRMEKCVCAPGTQVWAMSLQRRYALGGQPGRTPLERKPGGGRCVRQRLRRRQRDLRDELRLREHRRGSR